MDLDDHVCLCFRISKRKLVNYLKRQSLSVPSQLSECGGAGTGCGWCVPLLQQLFLKHQASRDGLSSGEELSAEAYAHHRDEYLKTGQRPNSMDAST